ncbi:sugar ABC transporter ATP-binding protein [Macrococcus armenti]|uniref:sugar ABC transporter ATP-binding protein n=1 Tax=Macrococcus armenti TaxID=2875764 RepID=UPI001CC91263|nr:sugar ABC transporter ATP-binding protein [Macrococcus armenti]UBH09041.1 sugar ABC transporter ATP-binding protein [Macrococcus armenti]UBH11333.1 sugar ABC transporter ATP-binding protein [Macrococcus armenti]
MIKMSNIHKAFGANKVLKGVDFSLNNQTVHALMGENGAGKSTLMNILSGIHQHDNGEIFVDGTSVNYKSPKESEQAGIQFIHQELNIWPEMTVLENLFVGKELTTKFGKTDDKKMKAEALKVFNRLDFHLPLNKVAGSCSIGEQQMIEISKALMTDAKVIIMDEPTAALTDKEIDKLFELINQLKSEGVSFVYISHRMDEIFRISDEITVMRDGVSVMHKHTEDTTYNELVHAMVGRSLEQQFPDRTVTPGDVLLEVKALSNDTFGMKGINFNLRKGEILGFSGLMGSGRTEIMRSLFGIDRGVKEVVIEGKSVTIKNPGDAIKHGLALITENRKDEGLVLDASIKDNMTMANLKSFTKNGYIMNQPLELFVDQIQQRLSIKSDKNLNVGALSGGNQQKVVIAKWVGNGPKVLILDEPTRGIDVGAKREIYNLMNELTERGISIIMVSSEMPEIIGLSDRVYVMQEGQIKGELKGKHISQENIMTLATGGEINE